MPCWLLQITSSPSPLISELTASVCNMLIPLQITHLFKAALPWEVSDALAL